MAQEMQTVEGNVVAGQQLHVQVLGDCMVTDDKQHLLEQHLLLDASGQENADYEMDSPEALDDGRRRLRRPLMSLSVREKTAICRYKAQHPECNQRQIAEHFTKLWGKEICRRRVSDILIQKEKWFDVERRVKGDADKTFRDGKFSQLEKLVFEWITNAVRSGERVCESAVREKAKALASMHDVKSFSATNGWMSGFKKRYGLKFDGDNIISAEFAQDDSSEYPRDENQIHLQGGDVQSYTVNITVDNGNQQGHPQAHMAMNPNIGRGGPGAPDVGMSDVETGDSGDEDQESSIGLAQTSQTHLPAAIVGGEQNMALDDIVKTIIYGGPSTSAQVITAAATQSSMTNEQYYHEATTEGAPPTKNRLGTRAKLTAILVRKVLVATKRKLDAETEMIKEQKQRHYYEAKMFEERRKRLIEERELIAAQRRKLEAETKFLNEQQRNEIIRRELLLADVATTRMHGTPKQSKIHSSTPVPIQVQQSKASYVTVVTGSNE